MLLINPEETMRHMLNALLMSLFVVSMSFAGSLNAEEVQVNDADAACASDICVDPNGQQVDCNSIAQEENNHNYCGYHWGWRWNGHRGWHNHGGHHHHHWWR
jgi:hypothetical protein